MSMRLKYSANDTSPRTRDDRESTGMTRRPAHGLLGGVTILGVSLNKKAGLSYIKKSRISRYRFILPISPWSVQLVRVSAKNLKVSKEKTAMRSFSSLRSSGSFLAATNQQMDLKASRVLRMSPRLRASSGYRKSMNISENEFEAAGGIMGHWVNDQ
jgi:hypothetical protein